MLGRDEHAFRATVDGLTATVDGLTAPDMMAGAMQQLWKQKDALLLQQLGQLVKDGLIEVVETQPVLCMEPSVCSADRTFTMRQAVALRLRDQEVIDGLRAENRELREKMAAFHEHLSKAFAAVEDRKS